MSRRGIDVVIQSRFESFVSELTELLASSILRTVEQALEGAPSHRADSARGKDQGEANPCARMERADSATAAAPARAGSHP